MRHTGQCGRCPAPTGSVYRQYCSACRQKARPKRRVVVQPKRGGKGAYRPVLGRMLPQALAGMPSDSWWTRVPPGQMTARATAEVPRMRMSRYGQMRGGPVIELWG